MSTPLRSQPRPQFAVVREDPDLEAELVRRRGARAVLVVASGGCTALTLAHRFPTLRVSAFDLNPIQLAHIRDKAAAVARGDLAGLDVSTLPAAPGLNQAGKFEALFRTFRVFLEEFVASPPELLRFFQTADEVERRTLFAAWTGSAYWPVAFTLHFHDDLLNAMFGPDATRHAQAGSYPQYFRRVFERGLRRPDAGNNPFLQHVFLGRYLPAAAPDYVQAGHLLQVTLLEGTLLEVPDLGDYDVISLSNIFDWSDDKLAADWAATLGRTCRPGTLVLMRQLNNERPLRPLFAPWFTFDDALGDSLLSQDRSLFYNRILVAVRSTGSA